MRGVFPLGLCHKAGDRLFAEPANILDIEQRHPTDPDGRGVSHDMGFANVFFQGITQGRESDAVKTQHPLFRRGSAQDFIEKDAKGWMGNFLETEWRLAHFSHAAAESGVVLRTKMAVQAEAHLQFIDRFSCDMGEKDLVQPPETIMKALQPLDTGLDSQTGFRRFFDRAQASECGQTLIRLVFGYFHDG